MANKKVTKFKPGESGNPAGRPKGSKNKVTVLKLMAEEAWRERNSEAVQEVLDLILAQALNGCKASQKLIFDAMVSKSNVSEEKSAGSKQEINIRTMEVTPSKGVIIDVEPEKETIQ